MRPDGLGSGRRLVALILLTAALGFGPSRPGHADPPQVTVGPAGTRIRIVSAPLSEVIDALARAGGFRVTYQGARPTAMLFNAEIEARTVGEALLRLLEGQSLNYGVVFDVTGASVTSLLVLAPASASGTSQATSGNLISPPPQTLPTPRRAPRRDAPSPEVEPEIGEPEPEPEPEPSPVATPAPATPLPTPPLRRLSPFAPRSPFATPAPTPPAAPSPSPSPSA